MRASLRSGHLYLGHPVKITGREREGCQNTFDYRSTF